MNKVWSNNLSDEQIKIVKESATLGRPALERLITILTKYQNDTIKSMVRDDHFTGDWSVKQATLVAELKTYKKIEELLTSLLTKR